MPRRRQSKSESTRPSTTGPSIARENRLQRDIAIDYLPEQRDSGCRRPSRRRWPNNTFSHYNISALIKATARSSISSLSPRSMALWLEPHLLHVSYVLFPGLLLAPSIARARDRVASWRIVQNASESPLSSQPPCSVPRKPLPVLLLSDSVSQGGFLVAFHHR